MDTRQRKTRAKLAEVILRLAAERPASELSVSEIASGAGLNRSTFYEHASSPVELLETVLRDELDEIRAQHLGDDELRSAALAISDTTVAVLNHIDSHDEVYRRGLGDGTGAASLQPMLSTHFEQSIDVLLEHHAVEIPGVPAPGENPGDPSSEFLRRAAARFIATGTVGAIEIWLREPTPRDTNAFMRSYRVYLPSRWPLDVTI